MNAFFKLVFLHLEDVRSFITDFDRAATANPSFEIMNRRCHECDSQKIHAIGRRNKIHAITKREKIHVITKCEKIHNITRHEKIHAITRREKIHDMIERTRRFSHKGHHLRR